MELALIKNRLSSPGKKRVFPRFPFCFLTFKAGGKVFEVTDVSPTGMQLSLKDGKHPHRVGQDLRGSLRWYGDSLEIAGTVQWSRGQRLGLHFSSAKGLAEFFSPAKVVEKMRPIHRTDLAMELPVNLKCWLRADGPVELFVWCHRDGEISSFQLLFMEAFLEWKDGKGLASGRILTRRDLETPLVQEGEFVFAADGEVDSAWVARAKELLALLPGDFLPEGTLKFLRMKIG